MAPYIFIQYFQFSENTYSFLLLVIGASYALGSILSKRFIEAMSPDDLLNIGFVLAFASALFTLLFTALNTYNIQAVLIPMIVYGISCGFISPACNTKAINALENEKDVKESKGVTSSILGGGVMIISSLLALATTLINFNQSYKLSIYVCSLVSLSFVTFLMLIKKQN